MPLLALMSSMPRRVSLVNLQKFTLNAWLERAEHEDVGAGAEDARLEAGEHDRVHFGMLEAQALQRVGELDVDAEVVRIELQLVVVRPQARVFAARPSRASRRARRRSASSACTGRGIDFEGDGRRSGSLFHGAQFTTNLNARSNSWYNGLTPATLAV